ncbi:MAG: hypothetical protein IJ920_05135 [Paludibacteraceae bacterium]|nr:hypothetical protein [Paludibacteraceae bacterium]
MADKLSPLVPHQKVFMVDAHGHELNPEERDVMYDDTSYDLHIHKKTNPIVINDKKIYEANIRIPINNPDREISVDLGDKQTESVPGRIKKEIKEALKDKKVRERFVKELSQIIGTYSSVRDSKERTEEALRRFAQTFGANNITIKDSWFTHIDKDQNNVSMLSILSENDNRYNFLMYKNFMLAEEAEDTKKFLFAITGAANRGKTEIVKSVYQQLLQKYPENAIIIEDGEYRKDIKAILFVNGAKVGIESQGDPGYRQERSIDEFVNMGCDVILTAGRTSGSTYVSYEKYKHIYQTWSYKRNKIDEKELRESENNWLALRVLEDIEAATINAFREL